ncbi:MAG TPA: MBL fold metallo-hydrolase [Quisquiliibacterium sp.]|nr:MBL fold metallo-hydrolase [Quisquiliibacterium sp.]HQP65178.1 MBL fold metallo-hydrolase [Quisquiliibacterium sp.]
MPREQKRLHEWREPVATRPAATILLLRDGPDGLEVLMTRRSVTASFAPGVFVFPGGALDAADASERARRLSRVRPDQPDDVRPHSVAAIREAFEELGILLAYRPDGSMADATDVARVDRSRDADFFEQLEAGGYAMALDRVWWLCHWITDRDLPKRFDVRFFVAPVPPGQEPVADEGEQFEPVWISPKQALERHERGDFDMIFPTVRTLRRLAQMPDVDAVLGSCSSDRPLWVSSPRGGHLKGEIARFSEHEPAFGELELVSPDGRIGHALDWQHEKAVPLLKNVQRLTAPNPGRMTGPGTNTYIIGEPGAYAVIDPGPDDPVHIERIAALVGRDLKYILCTHAHPDHSPGAAPLKAITGAPILGAPSGPNFRSEWQFTPDRTLSDGERIAVGDTTMKAIHTPGHASNHLCFLLEEDGLLLSGDHINNGSTVVIDPPDGDMKAYLEALERLLTEDFDYILPAHGWVLGFAHESIRQLIAHRLKREAKVLSAVRALKRGTMQQLLPRVYDDVDPIMYPVAQRSLLAHLLKLEADLTIRRSGEEWAAV